MSDPDSRGQTAPPQVRSALIEIVNDHKGAMARIIDWLRPATMRLRFVLCLGSTRTSDVQGISAAGATPKQRRLTPALDAELLALGKSVRGSSIPRSPAGVVSPVVITRACLQLLGCPITIVDCGVFRQPRTPFVCLGDTVADCVSSGAALPRELVEELYKRGLALGQAVASDCDCLILAESVPGGTTTAMAVLTLLGYNISGLISGSLPNANHHLKQKLVERGFQNGRISAAFIRNDPLAAVAAFGDPMQAVVAGITAAAVPRTPVILAGGCQMLAVYALLTAIWPITTGEAVPTNIGVCTTGWVTKDKDADTGKLARLVKAPLVATSLDFSKSRHSGLRAFEEGHVKEGCGAGAAMFLSALCGQFDEGEIISVIDDTYEEMIGRIQT